MRPLTLDRDLFDELADRGGSDLISIFTPTHSKGRDVSQDRIRLKNLLGDADSHLEELGFKPRERKDRLRLARDLLDDREFWEHQAEGLAIYIDDDGEMNPVSLDHEVAESAYVMPVFVMRPLLADLTRPEMQVLALTRGEVGLFEATTASARRIAVDLPESLDDVNWFVDRERQRQQHPDRTDTGRARHGHDPSVREEEDLARFLREVDRALKGNGPLIVLGDDELVSRFDDVTDRGVISPDNSGVRSPFTETEILEIAGPVAHSLISDRESKAVAEAKEQIGAGNATTDIDVAVQGALSGRIGHVVVDPATNPVWGRIDESTMDVAIHGEKQHADVDLVDRVIVLSMRNGADVTPIQDQPGEFPLIAINRF